MSSLTVCAHREGLGRHLSVDREKYFDHEGSAASSDASLKRGQPKSSLEVQLGSNSPTVREEAMTLSCRENATITEEVSRLTDMEARMVR